MSCAFPIPRDLDGALRILHIENVCGVGDSETFYAGAETWQMRSIPPMCPPKKYSMNVPPLPARQVYSCGNEEEISRISLYLMIYLLWTHTHKHTKKKKEKKKTPHQWRYTFFHHYFSYSRKSWEDTCIVKFRK